MYSVIAQYTYTIARIFANDLRSRDRAHASLSLKEKEIRRVLHLNIGCR